MKVFQFLLFVLIASSSFAQIQCDSIPSNFTTRYSDGAVKSTTNYLNGIKQGEYKEYYSFGNIGAKGNFTNGNFTGHYERYSPDGTVILRADIDEKGTGAMTEFNYNGEVIMTKGKFKDWKKSGVWRSYNYKGEVTKEKEFISSDSVDAFYALVTEYGFGEEPTGVYDFPTYDTEFVGGSSAMLKFIKANVNYPEAALKKRISGRVYVTFIVNEDGSITDAKVLREVDPDLDREAIRLINAMPPWTPAVEGGMRVKARSRLPIHFNVDH